MGNMGGPPDAPRRLNQDTGRLAQDIHRAVAWDDAPRRHGASPTRRFVKGRLVDQQDTNLLASASALLQSLLRDPKILAIYVDGTDPIYVQRGETTTDANAKFESTAQLMALVQSLASAAGVTLDERHPSVEFRHTNGLLVAVALPPVSAEGPSLVIRKPPPSPSPLRKAEEDDVLSRQMLTFLEAVLRAPVNVILSGNRGSDRVTFLSSLLGGIPPAERLALVEPLMELRIQRPRLLRLQTGGSELCASPHSYADVLSIASRLRVDRIVASELPAAAFVAAVDLATEGQTMMTSMHATSPHDAVLRLEAALQQARPGMSIGLIRKFVSSGVDLIIQRSRLPDGSRRIVSIAQVGIENNEFLVEEIFVFKITGMQRGRIMGAYEPTGIMPRVESLLSSLGIDISQRLFKIGAIGDSF